MTQCREGSSRWVGTIKLYSYIITLLYSSKVGTGTAAVYFISFFVKFGITDTFKSLFLTNLLMSGNT